MKPVSPRGANYYPKITADGLPEPHNLFHIRQSVSFAGGQIHILEHAHQKQLPPSSSSRHRPSSAEMPSPSPLKSLLYDPDSGGISGRRPLVSIYSATNLFDNNQSSPDYDVVKDTSLSQSSVLPSSLASAGFSPAESASPLTGSEAASGAISPVPSSSLLTSSFPIENTSTSLSSAIASVTAQAATATSSLSPPSSPRSPPSQPQSTLANNLEGVPSPDVHELLARATSRLKSSTDCYGSPPVASLLQQEEARFSEKPLALPRVLSNRPKAYHRQLTDPTPAVLSESASAVSQPPSSILSLSQSGSVSSASSQPSSRTASAPTSPTISAKSSLRSEPNSDGSDWRVSNQRSSQEVVTVFLKTEMRSAWQQEMDQMQPERVQWYHQQMQLQSHAQPSTNTVPKSPSAGRKQIKKQNEEIREALEAHRAQLKPMVGRGEAKLRELKDKELQLRTAAREQLDKLQSWHRPALVRVFRRLSILQLLHILISRAILLRKVQLISSRLEELTRLISLTKNSQTVVSLAPDIYEDANAIFGKKEVVLMVNMAQKIDKRIMLVKSSYLRMRTELSSEDRIGRVRQLLEAAQTVSIAGYHEWDTKEQESFDEVFLDQRAKEGKGILRLRNALANPKDPIVPADVVDFLEQFTEQFDKEHNFGPEQISKLRLFVSRSVYPRLYPFTWQMVAAESHLALDVKFRQQQVLLRPVIRQKLELDAKYFVEEHPFRDAIEALNDIPYHLVPSDMIKTLHTSMQLILTKACGINKKDIAADELLPLFIYVVCFCEVVKLHQHIAFMEGFASDYEKMTELGYCLTTFQAAVQHLMNLSV